MFFILACSTNKIESQYRDSAELNPIQEDSSQDTSDEVPPPIDGSFADAQLCSPVGVSDNINVGPFTEIEEPSPFGNGSQSSVVLGPITSPGVIEYAAQAGSVDYTLDMGAESYDLYVPPDYDGSVPYGLVGFINSGNSGAVKSQWISALEDQKLIWVGGQDIGNSVNVDIRMGKTILGMMRMLELYNIDKSRVYVTGNSGGARTAQVLSWLQPRTIRGAFPLCGASYFREVTQEFETQEPDSHYEYWGDYFYPAVGNTPYSEWIKDYPRPFALLTSSNDFRRGDILNVFHHGLQEDGFLTRYLEVGGDHCATDTQQANDAISFLDHPFFTVFQDEFSDGDLLSNTIGIGLSNASGPTASLSETSVLNLAPTEEDASLALIRNRFHWNDPHGVVLQMSMELSENNNTTLSFWAHDETLELSDLREGQLTSHPGIHFDLSNSEVYIYTTGMGGGIQPLFQGSTDIDTPTRELSLQIWSGGLQVDFGSKLRSQSDNLATLGADEELIRLRWSDLATEWASGVWEQDEGTTITLMARGSTESTITHLDIKDGVGIECSE